MFVVLFSNVYNWLKFGVNPIQNEHHSFLSANTKVAVTVSFTDLELNFDVVAAESHIVRSEDNACGCALFSRFHQNSYNSCHFSALNDLSLKLCQQDLLQQLKTVSDSNCTFMFRSEQACIRSHLDSWNEHVMTPTVT